MKTEIYGINGSKQTETCDLANSVFGIKEINNHLIYQAIRCELANKRQGTACTKERSDVRGGGKKPWRQKGTGRARVGSRRNPIFKGGGTVFGPQPRDYSYSLPKKQKRNSIKNILSLKAQNNLIKVVEDFKVESGKTKDADKILKSLTEAKRVVLIYKEDDPMLKRAFRNIPTIKTLSYKRLAAHDLFYAKEILILKSAADELKKFFGKK